MNATCWPEQRLCGHVTDGGLGVGASLPPDVLHVPAMDNDVIDYTQMLLGTEGARHGRIPAT